jgi:hypothetical protein
MSIYYIFPSFEGDLPAGRRLPAFWDPYKNYIEIGKALVDEPDEEDWNEWVVEIEDEEWVTVCVLKGLPILKLDFDVSNLFSISTIEKFTLTGDQTRALSKYINEVKIL